MINSDNNDEHSNVDETMDHEMVDATEPSSIHSFQLAQQDTSQAESAASSEVNGARNNFRPLLHKRLPTSNASTAGNGGTVRCTSSRCCSSLCHTMDLIAIGTGSSSSMIMSGGGGNSNGVSAVSAVSATSTFDGISGAYVVNKQSKRQQLHEQRQNRRQVCQALAAEMIASKMNVHISNTIVVRRTISWEMMLAAGPSDWASAATSCPDYESNEDHDSDDSKHGTDEFPDMDAADDFPPIERAASGTIKGASGSEPGMGGTYLSWSPDGRAIAIGLSRGHVLLFDVEASASPGAMPAAVHCLVPAPPSSSADAAVVATVERVEGMPSPLAEKAAVEDDGAGDGDDEEKETITGTGMRRRTSKKASYSRSISPVMTRSMTAARRKRLLRMTGQTPDAEDTAHPPQEQQQQPLPRPSTSPFGGSGRTSPKSPVFSKAAINQKPAAAIMPLPPTIKQVRKALGPSASSSVMALTWQRLVPRHARWSLSVTEVREEERWHVQRQYLDRGVGWFLPPCAYNGLRGTGLGFGGDLDGAARGAGAAGGSANAGEMALDRYQPQCQTPLSVLCMATAANGLHLYLHGRYRILSLDSPLCLSNTTTTLLCAADLTSILLCAVSPVVLVQPQQDHYANSDSLDKSNTSNYVQKALALKLYLLPAFASQTTLRYLQTISASYSSITSHIAAIQQGMKDVSAAWTSSLRQLDVKFDQLATLLIKYNVLQSPTTNNTNTDHNNQNKNTATIEEGVRTQLLNYILLGTRSSPEGGQDGNVIVGGGSGASNAMDQFFTHVRMNDQLLRQMERSLESTMADVEGALRTHMLAPVRALVYDAMDLRSTAVSIPSSQAWTVQSQQEQPQQDDPFEGMNDVALLREDTCTRLCEASHLLWIVTEQCTAHLVDIRFRLRDLVRWMRGTASAVRARGTAPDSVQRENARKRRVEDAAVRRVVEFLSVPLRMDSGLHHNGERGEEQKNAGKDHHSSTPKRGMTECILGILLSDYFTKDKVYSATNSATSTRVSHSLPKKHSQNTWYRQSHQLGSVDEHGHEEEKRKEYFNDEDNVSETPSIKSALNMCNLLAQEVFEHPRIVLARLVQDIDMVLEECTNHSQSPFVTAMQRRLGRGKFEEQHSTSSSSDEDDSDGDCSEDEGERPLSWFAPKNILTQPRDQIDRDSSSLSPGNSRFLNSRYWTIIANVCLTATPTNQRMFQITAIPTRPNETTTTNHRNCILDEDEFSEDEYGSYHEDDQNGNRATFASSSKQQYLPSFYLTAFVAIPEHCIITSMAFYGDDGNSTLTSEMSQTTVEGNQALGLLLERTVSPSPNSREEEGVPAPVLSSSYDAKEDPAPEIAEELWLVPYDDLDYTVVPFSSREEKTDPDKLFIRKFDDTLDVVGCIYADVDGCDYESSSGRAVCAKRRLLRMRPEGRSNPDPIPVTEMMVSGSRGIGSVAYNDINTIDVFDLEEDEDDEDEDSDEE